MWGRQDAPTGFRRATRVGRSWLHPAEQAPRTRGIALDPPRFTRTHPRAHEVRDNARSHNCLSEGVVVRSSLVFPAPAGTALRGIRPANPTLCPARAKV
jgi:hypothetical protein